MLVLNNVEVIYSDVIWVLRGVSLEVSEKTMVSLLGANGAGKSTTLKAISGLLWVELGEVTTGWVEFQGQRIHRKRAEEIARMGIIQVIEGHRLFEHLTAEENLKMGGHLIPDMPTVKKKLEAVYDYFPRLKERGRGHSLPQDASTLPVAPFGRHTLANF